MGFEQNSFLFFSPSRSLRRRAKKITKLFCSKPIFWIFFLGKKNYQSPILNLNFTPFFDHKKELSVQSFNTASFSATANCSIHQTVQTSHKFFSNSNIFKKRVSSKSDYNIGLCAFKRFQRRHWLKTSVLIIKI